MGKKACDFDCFKGYHQCKSVTFTDNVANSFTLNIEFRSYCKGSVVMQWDIASITLNGTVGSTGVFTAQGFTIPCNFNSKYTLSNYRAPAFFLGTVSGGSQAVTIGYLSFSGTTPVFNFFLNANTLTASTTFTLYGGAASWAQSK